jgi:hypothetical protein
MSGDLGREARRSRRHHLPDAPPVHDMLAERVLGRALDMSAGGLKLLVAEPLPADTLYPRPSRHLSPTRWSTRVGHLNLRLPKVG